MRVGMCDCDCVCLFFVSRWVLDCSLSLVPPSNVRPISSPPYYLPVVGVSACRCMPVCAGSLPVAASRGLDPWAQSGLCLGSDMSLGLGSLGPWLDLLRRRWLPGGSPGTLPCSFLGGLW
ncbi:hypothetical protein AMECASPLE_032019 [Ameca splendens]|uniref:Secreted protein n=1 Tax=Ameca splendens TaxID=208324 RepID=A0ABV0XVC0_9TELE